VGNEQHVQKISNNLQARTLLHSIFIGKAMQHVQLFIV